MLRKNDRLEAELLLEQPDNEISPDEVPIYKQSGWQQYYATWDNNILRPTTTGSGGGVEQSFGGYGSGNSM